MTSRVSITQDGEFRYRVPRQGNMLVDGIVYTTHKLLTSLGADDNAIGQVANVACLPGIVGSSLAMPDFHWGYGFPIGGVAAFDPDAGGIVSPGGVGYDINCGVRLLSTAIDARVLKQKQTLARLADLLFAAIPSGVGSKMETVLDGNQLHDVLARGAEWAVEVGYGLSDDTVGIEEGGRLRWAEPDWVPRRALERGKAQLGSIGSGNHFVEVDVVDEIYDEAKAAAFGLVGGQLAIQIHTGSRGLGHQTCEEMLPEMMEASARLKIELPDRQLCCAPIRSKEGTRYLGAMAAAANFAFANRQIITHHVREAVEKALKMRAQESQIRVVYDVCHNIAKHERHVVDGVARELLVHRKGATRALPAGDDRLPEKYRATGQPVLVPGDMGRYSYVLAGAENAEAFNSCCHGAGRVLSRKAATRAAHGRDIVEELARKGIVVRAASRATAVEEMPLAYKDVADVVDVAVGAGLAVKVARLVPLAVVKG